ncbi:hypothetical protein BDV27DRAFT_135127 [Aspergillus caelatus]|uniref:Uncharacterized protein n=1 Tax=Aspergillus caelatus TaxID=61420 RepID=A0A5N6ZR03_9EURO|nr:uncharacterized protein BDV27DRAFT_135127 [Aspergillus caelatus]KAE8360071.1 hypothetical protein BDV27DRAFT_135127 [Aspergillus caelatus]
MLWTPILKGSTGLDRIITYAFCIGDIDEFMAFQISFALAQILLNSSESIKAAICMTAMIMAMQLCTASK